MKKLSVLFLLPLALSCTKEQLIPRQGNTTFSMAQINRKSIEGRTAQNMTPSFVLLSIEYTNGKSVVEDKRLKLFTFGQGYVSDNLQLIEGNYKLIQFQILNANDTIIYASPIIGSDLATYITKPLPMLFSITKNKNKEVEPQVLPVASTDNPSNFGYVNSRLAVISAGNKRLCQQ